MDKDLRRLVLTLLAVLVFLFVGRGVLGSLYDDETAARAVGAVRRKLVPGGDAGARPERSEMSRVAALRDELRDELTSLVPQLAYERPDDFAVPDGASADLHYIKVLRREQENLVQGARFVGKSVPNDLGMPVPNPTGLEDVTEALRALHVVQRVVEAGLAADIAGVDTIRLPNRGRRRGRGVSLVRTHAVEFELRGSPTAIRETLRGMATGTPYLAVDDVRIESQDEDGELLTCRMTVAAISFDRDALDELEVGD